MRGTAGNKSVQKAKHKILTGSRTTSKTKAKTGRTEVVKPFYIAGVGASAGGINAVSELLSQFTPAMHVAVLIVIHLSKAVMGDIIVARLQKNTSLPCKIAEDNEIIKPGNIYLAPPDAHLLVKENRLLVGHGPAENRFRPSIDVLFRSMAVNHGEKAIGIILTGFLNDGTSGMLAIKESGGHCIVQDPNEAEYPDMPLSVAETLNVDHCVSLKQMGKIILEISKIEKVKGVLPPRKVVAESRISEKAATGIEEISKLGEKSVFACPDCGGGLWSIRNGHVKHYRCHIGHAYSEKDLVVKQSETIENTLWVAIRMMEERKTMLWKLAAENDLRGLGRISTTYREQSEQLKIHIEKLKEWLMAHHFE
ncbi:MAG TPA: chemotaxis protein CheB [Chitinophagaceae bacterium]|nr:chemotaxis protein CheB [Chitinophagaceae bacterium]